MTIPTSHEIVPWPADAAARYVAKGHWAGRTLGAQLAEVARRTPDAVCLIDGEVRLTFRELLSRADGAAERLRAIGVRPDDRILIQLPNRWEFVVVTVACFRLGAIPVWALTEHREHEISGLLAHTEAKGLVVPDFHRDFDHQALAASIAASAPALGPAAAPHVIVAGDEVWPGNLSLRDLIAEADDDGVTERLDAEQPAADAVVTLLLSGGTTGVPKLIPRTHNDLCYLMKQAADICRFGPDTVYLAVLPVGHGFVNTGPGILGALLSGGRVVIGRSPSPETAFGLIERERVTATSVVPTIVHRWLEHRAAHPEADLSSLRLLQVGAARLAPEVAQRIEPELGCTLQQVFGMGEGLLCLTRLDDPAEVVLHTQGRPVSPDDELLIVDSDGVPVADGEPGILLTRGPYTIRNYYRLPEVNLRSFRDGWYNTGDVVRLRPDGNLVVEGREKDFINRGGEKISAEEVESFAREHPAVREAAAVALPDPEYGEVVCLYAVPVSVESVQLAEIHAVMLDAGVAKFKLPQHLVVVDALPLTGVGKVDKKALRADAARRFAP
ncbi:MAG: AMP-binding protein [Hamadaea sp.]|uniref:(2,3-dihydroxybenzoyl)adenylate synthase n=1 Tax=Hamadaea sp. TaxID=2024425 RepID=UPI0017F79363|nr:AMP-binding protein [Hamadaea sp.]NUT21757.1 AMP-binding protein [Hamadaea sp.]